MEGNRSRVMIGKSKWSRRLVRAGAAGLVAGALGWFALPFAVPLPLPLLEVPVVSPVVFDRHGEVIARLPLADASRMATLTRNEVPPDLVAATLAAEDKRFFQHGGLDLLATLRAARDLLAHRRVMSGASTITQQLVKISSPPVRRNPATKVYEALAARRLEMTWSKDRILTEYLNRLDYGNLRTGAAEAARFYFQKPVNDLSLAECALIAGLPQAPTRLNPLRNPQQALARRNTVLRRMADSGKYAPARIAAALVEPLEMQPLREIQSAPWLAFAPQPSLPGAQTRTTLDLALQRDVEAIVREETSRLKSANLRHAAVVVIDNPTGEILALVSSADWRDPRGGQINGALTLRSPGSALKPFTYLLAIQQNQRIPSSIVADIPTPFRTPQGVGLPENYDRAYRGPVTLRTALACSLNLPAMRELNALGGPRPLFHLLTELGLTTLGENPSFYGLGLTLGNAPVRLLELTNAYAALARQGRAFPAVLFPPSMANRAEQSCDPLAAYLIADILADPAARAPAFQPGGPLDLPFRCAVKTGTSSDFRDNWCLGFTPRFTVGVWAGNFENQPMKGISGIDGAGPIFHRTMVRLARDSEPTWFPRPAAIADIHIDPRNGKLVSANAKFSRPEIAPADRLPPAATADDYQPDGKALLDPTYADWFVSHHNHRRSELAMDATARAVEPLRIISPVSNATFLLDPEIPSGSSKLRPVTNLPGTAEWKSDTLVIESATPEPIIHLTAGTHTVTATDPATGVTHTLVLRVKSL